MADPSSYERLHVVLMTPSHATASRVHDVLRAMHADIDVAVDADEASPLIRTHTCDAFLIDLDAAREQEIAFISEVRELSPWLPLLCFGVDPTMRAAVRPGPGLVLLRDLSAAGPRLVEEVQARRECRRNARLLRCVEDARRLGLPLGHAPLWRGAIYEVDNAIRAKRPLLLIGEPSTGRRRIARYVHESSCGAPNESDRSSGDDGFLEVDAAFDAEALGVTKTVYFPEVTRLGGECMQELAKLAAKSDGPQLVLATTRGEECMRRSSVASFLTQHQAILVRVPALRDRREDIAMLATAFLDEAADDMQHQGFSLRALTLLQLWNWPGNLSELARVVSTAWDLAGGRQIGRRHLVGPGARLPASLQLRAQSLGSSVDSMLGSSEGDVLPFEAEERRILAHALAAMGGNVTRAAEALEIGRATLYRKIRHFGLRAPRDNAPVQSRLAMIARLRRAAQARRASSLWPASA